MLEFNLLSQRGGFGGNTFFLLNRKREELVDPMTQIPSYLNEIIPLIENSVMDKSLIDIIQTSGSNMTVPTFQSIRYLLSKESQLDIMFFNVPDNSPNEFDIPEGLIEFNIINKNWVEERMIPMASKFNQQSSDWQMSTVYESIMRSYQFFDKNNGFDQNPAAQLISYVRANESTAGQAPIPVTTGLNAMFSYMGIEVINIIPSEV